MAWSRIAFIEAPFCDGCGAPFDYDMGEGARCAGCQARAPAFDRARAACLYDEHSRDLILKLKHADRTDLAGLFARWIARAAADLLPEVDAVVPVPLHRWRLLSRRYNQAAEIARPLARLAARPICRTLWCVRARRRARAASRGRAGGATSPASSPSPPASLARADRRPQAAAADRRRADHRGDGRRLRARPQGGRRGGRGCRGDRARERTGGAPYMTEPSPVGVSADAP